MDIWDENKLAIFIMFFIPGFICVKMYGLIYPSQRKDAGFLLYDAVTYSCINYALWSWAIYLIETYGVHPVYKAMFYFFIMFLSPILIVFIWNYIRSLEIIKKLICHPSESAWDYVFSQRKRYWVEVFLKDKTVVAGYYGGRSFASSALVNEHIYLEERWIIDSDGAFERKVERSAGVIILHSEISHIEFREEN
ncbi:DUF6338 family protein [Aeromonas veronii]|uniref:DUF6338 family protein n=1 Tax=Aeromonas veronii TaxID=654 RepID=UPI0038B6515A